MPEIFKISALLAGSALLMFAGGLQGLLLSIRGGAEGFSLTSLGLIGTGWSFGFIAGTLLVPKLVSRVGHVRAYSVMATLAAVVILLNLIVIEETAWIVLRAFSGFCFAGAAMIVESWLNEVTDGSRRGTVFAFYTTTNLAFATAGQAAIAVVGVAGFLPFVVGAIAFGLAVLPTAMSVSPQPKPLVRARLDLMTIIRNSPLSVIAALAVGIAAGAFGAMAPIYGLLAGFEPGDIALVMALSIVAGALAQLPFGRLSDRYDRRIILIITSLLAALAGALLAVLNPGPGVLVFVLFALYGLSANAIYPVAVAHANDFAKDGNFASITAGLLLVLGIGLAIGPVLAALAMSAYTPASLFGVTAAFHLALAVASLLRMRARARPSSKDREAFRAVPQGRESTQQTVALDPRSGEDGGEASD
jgi:MFS family permease